MFNLPVRVLLILVSAYFAYGYYETGHNTGFIVSVLAILILIYGYFAYGTVNKSFALLKKNEIDAAKKAINETRYPNLLSRRFRAQFHFIHGYIFLDPRSPDLESSKSHFLKATEIRLGTDNNMAMAFANLASIEVELGNKESAKDYLKKALSYEAKGETTEFIKTLKAEKFQ